MDKVIGVITGLAFVALIVFGLVCLATLLVNYVLATLGVAFVASKLFVFVCMVLLSWVGSYFRTQTVKVST